MKINLLLQSLEIKNNKTSKYCYLYTHSKKITAKKLQPAHTRKTNPFMMVKVAA